LSGFYNLDEVHVTCVLDGVYVLDDICILIGIGGVCGLGGYSNVDWVYFLPVVWVGSVCCSLL
jgi:hypothetical protein